MDASRKGKIASLPAQIREEVNQRLHNGEQAPQILPWLNAQEAVRFVLQERWDNQDITPQNLSEWRNGGYKDWLARSDRVSAIKTLSDYSLKLAKAAGGSLSEGAAAIAGGRILELLERVADGETASATAADETGAVEVPFEFNLEKLTNAVATLGHVEVARQKEDRQRQALGLDVQRFQYRTVEKFFDFYEDQRAREIMDSDAPRPVQMDQMVQLMFGEKPG